MGSETTESSMSEDEPIVGHVIEFEKDGTVRIALAPGGLEALIRKFGMKEICEAIERGMEEKEEETELQN